MTSSGDSDPISMEDQLEGPHSRATLLLEKILNMKS